MAQDGKKKEDSDTQDKKEPIHFVKPHYHSRIDIILAIIDRGLDDS